MTDPGLVSNNPSNAGLAIQNSVYAFLAITTQLLGTTIIFFVIARMEEISIADFGRLTYAFALAQLVVVFFEYGLVPFLAKKIAANPEQDQSMERGIYGLHLSLMVVGFGIYYVIVSSVSLEVEAREICFWIGASVFLTTTMRFFYAYYQGRERHHAEFASTIIEIAIQVTVIASLFIANADVITVAKWYFFGRLLAWVCTYLVLGVSESWLYPTLLKTFWLKTLREALPFNLTFVTAFAITSVDTIMLQMFALDDPERQVGLYQAALRLVLIPTILATVVTRVFLPQLTRMGGDTVTHLRALNNILMNIGVLAALFCFFEAREMTLLAYGDQYGEAAVLVAPLAITLALRFGAAYNLYFTLTDQMWLRFLFATIALTCLIGLNYWLIPIHGVMGTVYASIATHLIYWLPILIAMQIKEQDALLGWRWYYTIGIAILYGGALWLLQAQTIWLVVLVSIPFASVAVAYSVPADTRVSLIRGLASKLKSS